MEEIICVYKPVGATPLQLIEKLRASDIKYENIKIGYAGRLDPLAHGVMLLTVGEGNKVRDKYLGLNKKYQFSVLFGVETDSYDYLGVLQTFEVPQITTDFKEKIQKFIKIHTGTFSQTYPPFSSKPVNGVPLYRLTKMGKISKKDLPKREVEVFNFNLLSVEEVDSKVIRANILKNLRKIKGHFRQGKIIKSWQQFFVHNQSRQFVMGHFEIECGSGTYVRSLAQKLGEQLGCGAIAFEIFRTGVGEYNLDKAIRLQV